MGYELRRTGTFLDSKAPSISNVTWGCFPDVNINWYRKLAVMIRNRLQASACRLLPLWQRAWLTSFGRHAPSTCGCALPLRLSICCQRLRKENQSHQHDSKKYTNFIYNPKKPPEKIAQKMGVARDCHAHCRDGD